MKSEKIYNSKPFFLAKCTSSLSALPNKECQHTFLTYYIVYSDKARRGILLQYEPPVLATLRPANTLSIFVVSISITSRAGNKGIQVSFFNSRLLLLLLATTRPTSRNNNNCDDSKLVSRRGRGLCECRSIAIYIYGKWKKGINQ